MPDICYGDQVVRWVYSSWRVSLRVLGVEVGQDSIGSTTFKNGRERSSTVELKDLQKIALLGERYQSTFNLMKMTRDDDE